MNTERDTYRAAYFEASDELKKIHQGFEELSLRREKIVKVIDALRPRLGLHIEDDTNGLSLTSQLEGTTVITRLAVTYSSSKR